MIKFEYKVNADKCYLLAEIKTKIERVKIFPLADIHIGAKGFDEKRFLEYLKYIKEEPVLCYLGGDILEMALADSPGSAVFEQVMRPKEQMLYALDKLQTIKDKILFAQPGNHEARAIKRTDIDPLFWIMKVMGIADRHFGYPNFATVRFLGHNFNFYVQHGKTNAQTEGGKINAASRPSAFTKDIHFYCMGHIHDSHQSPLVSYRWEISGGKYILKKYIQYVIITPAFYNYWQTYAAEAAMKPASGGAVVPCLLKNGQYDARS